jgi:hypothetical protein
MAGKLHGCKPKNREDERPMNAIREVEDEYGLIWRLLWCRTGILRKCVEDTSRQKPTGVKGEP